MTAKDYRIIAAALKAARPERFRDHGWDACVVCMVRALSADNVKFNKDRFIGACGGYWSEGSYHAS